MLVAGPPRHTLGIGAVQSIANDISGTQREQIPVRPDTARVSAFGSQPDWNWRQATTVVRPQGPLLSKSTLPRPGDASDAPPKLRVQR